MANHVDLPDLSRLSKWKQNFDETAEHGATSKFVRELEAIGRKLKLPLINASMYKVDAKSFDLRKLSGYGCFGSTIDRDAKWSPKGTPVDEIDHLGYKLHSCYRYFTYVLSLTYKHVIKDAHSSIQRISVMETSRTGTLTVLTMGWSVTKRRARVNLPFVSVIGELFIYFSYF